MIFYMMGNCANFNRKEKNLDNKNHPNDKCYRPSSECQITEVSNNECVTNSINITIESPHGTSANWIQLAGHPDSFIANSENTILKQQPTNNSPEIQTYRALMNETQIRCCIPKFYREVENDQKKYIELEDLLQHFNNPNAIDIKIGTRTFQESEVDQQVLRPDLFEKMYHLDPTELSQEELAQKAVTKLRYMKFREAESSTATFGFRIEGIKMSNGLSYSPEQLKRIKLESEIVKTITTFIGDDATVSQQFSERLRTIRTSFENSQHFKTTEIIGSSLLLLYDKTKADVWMIDFGKTTLREQVINHRQPWTLGNHEDGYLTGLDNLIQIMDEITENLRQHKDIETIIE